MVQVAFTIKELRELYKLPGASVQLNPQDFMFSPEEEQYYTSTRPRRRLTELLKEMATANSTLLLFF